MIDLEHLKAVSGTGKEWRIKYIDRDGKHKQWTGGITYVSDTPPWIRSLNYKMKGGINFIRADRVISIKEVEHYYDEFGRSRYRVVRL